MEYLIGDSTSGTSVVEDVNASEADNTDDSISKRVEDVEMQMGKVSRVVEGVEMQVDKVATTVDDLDFKVSNLDQRVDELKLDVIPETIEDADEVCTQPRWATASALVDYM